MSVKGSDTCVKPVTIFEPMKGGGNFIAISNITNES